MNWVTRPAMSTVSAGTGSGERPRRWLGLLFGGAAGPVGPRSSPAAGGSALLNSSRHAVSRKSVLYLLSTEARYLARGWEPAGDTGGAGCRQGKGLGRWGRTRQACGGSHPVAPAGTAGSSASQGSCWPAAPRRSGGPRSGSSGPPPQPPSPGEACGSCSYSCRRDTKTTMDPRWLSRWPCQASQAQHQSPAAATASR